MCMSIHKQASSGNNNRIAMITTILLIITYRTYCTYSSHTCNDTLKEKGGARQGEERGIMIKGPSLHDMTSLAQDTPSEKRVAKRRGLQHIHIMLFGTSDQIMCLLGLRATWSPAPGMRRKTEKGKKA